MSYVGFREGLEINLSPREMDCLLLLVKYRKTKKASDYMGITAKTFNNHLNNIREKIANRYHLEDLVNALTEKINRI